MLLLFTKNLFLQNGETRYWNECNASTFIWRQSGSQRWNAHERTWRLVIETKTENVSKSFQTRSFHESETTLVTKHFVKERWDPLLIMTIWVMSKTMVNEANMEKHAQSTSVWDVIHIIENHPDRHALQQDLPQIKHITHSNQNQRKWFRTWATSNCSKCSRRNPNAVRSMPIILDCRHRLLYMRVFLAERNGGQSKIR